MIDLRSDTVTKPTAGMLEYMMDAEVGDDVFGEDPTTNRFEQKIAAMFGLEAGLFVPSGTMANQLCLHVLAGPGDEVVIDHFGHIFNYETAAAALLSSVQLHPVKGVRGKLSKDLIAKTIRTKNDWDPITKAIALENTTNKGGGAFYEKEELQRIKKLAEKHGIAVHLDGARIWNAMEASGIEPGFFGTIADTMSVCFSKGLGAPAGSMVLSTGEHIQRARRARKMWGGGMRQTGILSAAAEYAVIHHRKYLKNDHKLARKFAKKISELPSFNVNLSEIETNIVLFDVVDGDVEGALKYLSAHSIGMAPFGGHSIRATFHFQISEPQLDFVIGIMKQYSGRLEE